jgi:PqqD family protein of HPr-rel-A system
MTQAAKRWKCAELVWMSWDNQFVAFNLASGDTHLLTPVAARVLKMLEQQPLDLDGLSQQLASTARITPDEQLLQQTNTLLDNLDQLGLIEPETE